MKTIFTFLICSIFITAHGQYINISFDDATWKSYVFIDTVNYHHNIWQVGAPHKSVFTSAFSTPNAIVTDTTLPYPPNDTSVFIVKVPGNILPGSIHYPLEFFSFSHQLNIDSATIAKIEFSTDTSISWSNLLDSLPMGFSWLGGIPDLHDNTSGWTQVILEHDFVVTSDTLLFRFTFISDSTFSSNDGWIIDNIFAGYQWEGLVPQIQNNSLISIYPNPSQGNIYIHVNKQFAGDAVVTIYNMQGLEVFSADKLLPNEYLNLPLPNGTYVLKYTTDNEYDVKQIIIDR